MRILITQPGPAFSVHDVYTGWVEALRGLGQTVLEFNLDARLTFYASSEFAVDGVRRKLTNEQVAELAVNGLYAALYKTRPDVLLVMSGFYAPVALLDLARRYGTKVVIVHTESPYEDERQLKLAAHADLNLTTDPTNIERFNQLAPTRYVPHAYRPQVHCPGDPVPDLVCDLGFVGTGYKSRIEFLERMNLDGLDVMLAGNWQALDDDSPLRKYVGHDVDQCLDNTDTVKVYRSARVGLNLYRREAEKPELSAGMTMGPREVEMAATGCFFLRDSRPEGDRILSMLPVFHSPEEAGILLRYYLPREDLRANLAAKARAAIADRTFANHAKQLMRLLETE